MGNSAVCRDGTRPRLVKLWVFEPDVAETMRRDRNNPVYLPGVRVPEPVQPSDSLEEVLWDADIVISAVPSHVCRDVYGKMLPYLKPEMVFVTATKASRTRR